MSDAIVAEVKDFFQARDGDQSESYNRRLFTEDVKFAFEPGAQWDEDARNRRQGRPCYEYNRTVGAINQLVGDQRKVRPSGRVRPTVKLDAMPTASTFGGLIRDIEAQSGAPAIYAEAFKYSAAGGFGHWRFLPQWADGESFDQVLRLHRIENQLNVYFDGGADPFGRGAFQCVILDRISKIEFEGLYPGITPNSLQGSRDAQSWLNNEQVGVAEYYRRDARKYKIALLSTGQVVPVAGLREELDKMEAAGLPRPTVDRERDATKWIVTWYKVDGGELLEGPIEYEYKHIPVVRCPGRFVNIEGRRFFESLHRHGKDAARTYNYNRSSMVETVALTPRAPYLVTEKMIAGYEPMWARANVSNSPYLLYNPDEDFPELKPERKAGPEVPQAFIALAAHDAEDIRQTIGYTNPAVEQQRRAGDAESGSALRTRLTAGDSGSFEFLDNFALAVQYGWEIMVDMIPQTYDRKRLERILGDDGREDFVELDPAVLKRGAFDVTVTLGPAYATAREQALDTLMTASERMPILAEEAPDIIVRNLDVDGAQEIEARVRRRLINQGRIQPTAEEAQQMAAEPKPAPDPQAVALTNRLQGQADYDRARAAKTTVETAASMAEADTARQRQSVEIAEIVSKVVLNRVEAMLAQRELISPRPPAGGPGT